MRSVLPVAAGASVGAEGPGRPRVSAPPTSASLGLGHLLIWALPRTGRVQHRSTAPAQWFLLEPLGRGLTQAVVAERLVGGRRLRGW